MLMTDTWIRDSVKNKTIGIEPFEDAMVQPASYDIRLGNMFIQYDQLLRGGSSIDPERDNSHLTKNSHVPDGGTIQLHPGQFMLGHTIETITLSSRVAARLEGRSSLGRLGLIVHSTAGFIDPGFTGQVTLELSNLAPYSIVLRPGSRVGQICFIPLAFPSAAPYGKREGSKYQGQAGAVASRAHQDTW